MALAPGTVKCPRCGLLNPVGVSVCKACGLPRTASSMSPSPGHTSPTSTPAHSPSPLGGGVLGSTSTGGILAIPSILGRLLGWTGVKGVVIHVDPPYMARPEFNWPSFLVKGGLLILFLPVILGAAIGMFAISAILSIFGLRRGGSGFFSNLASQVTGFFLTSKLLGPKADVPVHDARLRDGAGNEHLVRFRGDFVMGNVNVGDDVTVEGFNRGGTLIFHRGYNHRIHSEIRVKHP